MIMMQFESDNEDAICCEMDEEEKGSVSSDMIIETI